MMNDLNNTTKNRRRGNLPGRSSLPVGGSICEDLKMYEIGNYLRMQDNRPKSGSRYPTAIQRINFPIYKGKPNPVHGKFFFVGAIPAECYDEDAGHSKRYDTEEQAIEAAITAGADRIQRCDCSFVDMSI